jgi:hypothetical protein
MRQIEEIITKLREAADESERRSIADQVVADHFRPKFDACFKDGEILDLDLATNLKQYSFEMAASARDWMEDAELLREAADLLEKSKNA